MQYWQLEDIYPLKGYEERRRKGKQGGSYREKRKDLGRMQEMGGGGGGRKGQNLRGKWGEKDTGKDENLEWSKERGRRG